MATRGRLSVVTAAVALMAAVSIAATGRSFSGLSRAVMFDTPEADAILAALPVFPRDNPWNQDISSFPVHRDSSRIIESIGGARQLDYNLDMNFIIVPPDQPRVPVKITLYPQESDPGPFPIPSNAPIENWPMHRNEDTAALPWD